MINNQRKLDLLQYCKAYLHSENLISDEEYSWLLVEENHRGVSRLEKYDALRAASGKSKVRKENQRKIDTSHAQMLRNYARQESDMAESWTASNNKEFAKAHRSYAKRLNDVADFVLQQLQKKANLDALRARLAEVKADRDRWRESGRETQEFLEETHGRDLPKVVVGPGFWPRMAARLLSERNSYRDKYLAAAESAGEALAELDAAREVEQMRKALAAAEEMLTKIWVRIPASSSRGHERKASFTDEQVGELYDTIAALRAAKAEQK